MKVSKQIENRESSSVQWFLLCMPKRWERAREDSWSDSCLLCTCWQPDPCEVQRWCSRRVTWLFRESQDDRCGTSQTRQQRKQSANEANQNIAQLKRSKFSFTLSPSAGAFPSLNWMIFWVVGRNWQEPVHGEPRAVWSIPMFERPLGFESELILCLVIKICKAFACSSWGMEWSVVEKVQLRVANRGANVWLEWTAQHVSDKHCLAGEIGLWNSKQQFWIEDFKSLNHRWLAKFSQRQREQKWLS